MPQLQKPAPHFAATAVIKGGFRDISLIDYKDLDFTFVCATEIVAFSDRAAEFRNISCDVVACSTDSQ